MDHRYPRGRFAAATGLAMAIVLAALVAAPVSAAPAPATHGPVALGPTGPSTVTAPYVLPVADGVRITSLLTVGDGESASNGYEMVGVPDGLGLMQRGRQARPVHEPRAARRAGHRPAPRPDRRLRVALGHRSADPRGQARVGPDRPGRAATGTIPNGDLRDRRRRASPTSPPRISTFGGSARGPCRIRASSSTSGPAAATAARSTSPTRRTATSAGPSAVTDDGQATALPRLGLFSWENTVPAANRTDTTLVIGDEDGPTDGSQLWVYVGHKQRHGDRSPRAGLTNGLTHVIDAVEPGGHERRASGAPPTARASRLPSRS